MDAEGIFDIIHLVLFININEFSSNRSQIKHFSRIVNKRLNGTDTQKEKKQTANAIKSNNHVFFINYLRERKRTLVIVT